MTVLASVVSSFGDALDTLAESESTAGQNSIAAVDAEQSQQRTIMIIVSLAVIAAAVLIGLLVARAVVRPLLPAFRAMLGEQLVAERGDRAVALRGAAREEVGMPLHRRPAHRTTRPVSPAARRVGPRQRWPRV